MKLDFDNLRLQALNNYEALVEKLNDAVIKEDDYADLKGRFVNIKGKIIIDADDIREELADLRMQLVAFACCEMKGTTPEDDVKSVLPDRMILSLKELEN